MKDVKLIDENGMYLYSQYYEVSGKDLEVLKSSTKASLAGIPKVLSINMFSPYMVCMNPLKKIDKDKNYKIIIIESDK